MANNNHFELTLDTLAPVGSVTASATVIKAQTDLDITLGGATYMYVWYDTVESPTAIPAGTAVINAVDTYTTQFASDGNYYYHVVLVDNVGNNSAIYSTAQITYDTTAPTVSTVELKKRDGTSTEIVTTRDIAVTFTFSDALSGCVSCAISGDINSTSTAWSSALTDAEIQAGSATRNIVLSGTGEEEVTKTVSITVTDAAGNTSAAVSDTIYLDTKFLVGAIVLRDKDDAATITNQWVNVADFVIALTASDKSDWKGYKVWGDFNSDGGSTATTEPSSYTDLTEAEKTAKRVALSRKFTSGDSSAKNVYAKIIDESGNETTLTSVLAKVDYTAPTVSIAIKSGTKYVSKVDGYKTKVLVPTFDGSISGIKNYEWKVDGASYTGGSGTGDPSEFTISADNLGNVDGDKLFTLTVVDNAGNTTTSEGVNIFLDTTAPTGTATMDAWYNGDSADTTKWSHFSTAGVTASATDAGSGMASGTMTVWCSGTATDTSVPAGATAIAYKENPAHADVYWGTFATTDSDTCYIHIKYVDAVGNVAYVHSNKFGIDRTAPTGSIAFTAEAYSSTSASVNLTFSDVTSGMGTGAKYKVWGDISSAATEQAATWTPIVDSLSVTLTGEDGIKTINVKYMDVAGNMTASAAQATAELDRSTPSVSVQLRNPDDSDVKPAFSTEPKFAVRFTPTDDQHGSLKYIIYGDFTVGTTPEAQGITEQQAIAAGWQDFVPVSGQTYMLISGLVCTASEGVKTAYVKVKDNAGNISSPGSAQFTYDLSDPTVDITTKDYTIVSTVHTKRLDGTGGTVVELEAYNDEVKFTFAPDSDCQAYKVCAYVSQNAAKAGSHADAAVPTTAGSTNMSATGIEFGPGKTAKTISSMIKGADYETALITTYDTSGMTQKEAEDYGFVFEDGTVNAIDGAHYVVVYVQDLSGRWSNAAEFEA